MASSSWRSTSRAIVVASHHILAALGVDATGAKHLLRLTIGSSENVAMVKALLGGLIDRGMSCGKHYLFVIDGSKALRSGIDAPFGRLALVRRWCGAGAHTAGGGGHVGSHGRSLQGLRRASGRLWARLSRGMPRSGVTTPGASIWQRVRRELALPYPLKCSIPNRSVVSEHGRAH